MLAGLNDDFIDSIEVFRQSGARPPTVRWFDPGAESGLAGEGDSHLLDQLGKDLELVMVPVARQDDIVLVRDIPSRDLRKHLIDVGFDLPEFVELDSRQALAHRRLHEFAPWAWTPHNHRVAEPLVQSVRRPPPEWSSEQTELFRKSWSSNCLRRWLSQDDQNHFKETPTPDWFAKSDCVGIEIFEPADVRIALDEIRSRGYEKAVFKLDLSASGRGQRRLGTLRTGSQLDESDEAWLQSVFNVFKDSKDRAFASPVNSGGRAIAVLEPELERVVELSFLWDVSFEDCESAEGMAVGMAVGTAVGDRTLRKDSKDSNDLNDACLTKYLGWTRALVTAGRKYTGTRLSLPFVDYGPEVRQFLLADRAAKLETISNWLAPRLAAELSSRNFAGCFGVDAFVFRGIGGQLLVKPVVEFNPRMTMGHVALSLQKKSGCWRGVGVSDFDEVGVDPVTRFNQASAVNDCQRRSLVVRHHPIGRSQRENKAGTGDFDWSRLLGKQGPWWNLASGFGTRFLCRRSGLLRRLNQGPGAVPRAVLPLWGLADSVAHE